MIKACHIYGTFLSMLLVGNIYMKSRAESSAQEAYVNTDGTTSNPLEVASLEYGEDIGVRQFIGDDEGHLEEIKMILQRARQHVQSRPSNSIECRNNDELCTLWALEGECQSNPQFMNSSCAPVCAACEYQTDVDDEVPIERGVDQGEDIGVRQYIDLQRPDEIQEILRNARQHLSTQPNKVTCKNTHESCSIWALNGECEGNPRFMNFTCAPVCGACASLMKPEICHHDPNGIDHWYPGDLNRAFERILAEHAEHFGVWVASRPYLAPGDTQETASYKIGPWVLVVDKFMSRDEADYITKLGEKNGYTRAMNRTSRHKSDEDIQYTATTVYCQFDGCYDDPVHQSIRQRMANVSFIPVQNYEYFQMIKYGQGEYFKVHNDFVPHHGLQPGGVRILTFLVYHSDVEEGGGTIFPDFNDPITVLPMKGRAVIFPCTINDDPNTCDKLMTHASLPVVKGIKYAINTHAHQRDYMTLDSNGCNDGFSTY